MAYYIGIDTSNYTTSLAVVNDAAEVVCDFRQILSVKTGEKGLRQSDAFYQHVMHFPDLFNQLPDELMTQVKGVGVSTQPRPVVGSYMPVFNAGMKFAEVISKMTGLLPFEVSHQEGHIMASLYDRPEWLEREVLSIHASGGTTEILKSSYGKNQRFVIDLIGGTRDISFGQLIDRIGVALGFRFPCGQAMESFLLESGEKQSSSLSMRPASKLAKNHFNALIKVNSCQFNLSGFENKAHQLMAQGIAPEVIIRDLFSAIGRILGLASVQAMEQTGVKDLVLAGGVMSNALIRDSMNSVLKAHLDCKLHFGLPKLCTDNAVGVALMTRKHQYTLL